MISTVLYVAKLIYLKNVIPQYQLIIRLFTNLLSLHKNKAESNRRSTGKPRPAARSTTGQLTTRDYFSTHNYPGFSLTTI